MAAKFACHALFFYAVTRFVLDGSEIADRLELSKARLRRPATNRGADLRVALPAAAFFISTANDECPGVRLSAPGVLDSGYKYDRMAGALEIEDTLVIPMTRHQLPDASRALVREKLPAVWNAIP
jgi:hypothetical protein